MPSLRIGWSILLRLMSHSCLLTICHKHEEYQAYLHQIKKQLFIWKKKNRVNEQLKVRCTIPKNTHTQSSTPESSLRKRYSRSQVPEDANTSPACRHHSSDTSQSRHQTSTKGVSHDMGQNNKLWQIGHVQWVTPQRDRRFQQHQKHQVWANRPVS